MRARDGYRQGTTAISEAERLRDAYVDRFTAPVAGGDRRPGDPAPEPDDPDEPAEPAEPAKPTK